MSVTSDLLFAYLHDVFYNASNSKIDINMIEKDYVLLAKGLVYFAQCVSQYNEFASALAKGDLSVLAPPPENELAAPLKSLQANLKHLTWQSQQVAKGDYKQRVDFMGEFADAFNTMVEQLADRQDKLEDEIKTSHKHAQALEQSNLLLGQLTQYIPEQIFVVSVDTHKVLHTNSLARDEIEKDPNYIVRLMNLLPDPETPGGSYYFETQLDQGNLERFLAINTYEIEWQEKKAVALVINDVSIEKKQLRELENFAYRDALTHAYNRFYGMFTLNEWLDVKKRFVLVFVDLDNLKYVNDVHGHNEGDEYIRRVAGHLRTYSFETVVCRVGGDEFMLLAPDATQDEASIRMEALQNAIQNDEYLHDKDYYYSISLGIVAVDENNSLSASDVLSIADERMYTHKRLRKKERHNSE